ncbi:hypothetical protein [Absidia glauca]|uniref:GSKIP domain-containing protein n=1 Tax=Absidia glauca TaxID=4829 RepID=A0A168MC08_ABSGL|nr:hypothetical protein [Absidia glauca]
MQFSTLNKELDAVCTNYDYGIVPGSVTVFARDSIAVVGKLELTLLEGIMVIIEISGEGSMVTSCTPLLNTPISPSSLKLVQDHLEYTFDTIDKLLMTISPIFAQRFLDKIQSSITLDPATASFDPLLPPPSTASVPYDQQAAPSSSGNDIFEWIH